jgi:hypothetical protein
VRRFAPQLFAQFFSIPLVLFISSNSYGQFPGRPGNNRNDIPTREWALANIRQEAKMQYAREKLLAQLALRDDFRKLQIVNNDLMKRVFLGSRINAAKITPKEIESSLGEIKKLAKRLKTNLALPESEKESTSGSAYSVDLSPGLLMLDKAVMDFVENPMFQQPRVFDSELALKAGKDIDKVLRLSDFLRKRAREGPEVK